jgi:LCP family protein required for cell wall assembly
MITEEKPKKSWKKIFFGFLMGAFLAIVLWFGVNILLAGKNILVPNIDGKAPWFLPKLGLSKLKGEGDGRINILLLGIGGGKHPGANLTDTIMLVSIDPINKKVGLLSIPRDLYVPIEGVGYNKINYAHSYGEANPKTTGGGPALAKKTVSNILDLPIHYFVRMDFDGFVKLVDEVGGVDIYVEKPISDPYYPAPDMIGYQPFYLKAGQYHMDGNLALKYVRSRETTSDFDRSKRQQQFLGALFDKMTSLGVLANPTKVTKILNILGKHVSTDFNFWEIERLVGLIKDIKTDKVVMKVLDSGTDGLLTAQNNGNGYYLVPKSGNFKEIQKFVHEFLTEPYLEQETAKIEIQNGSSQAGLAQEVADLLKSYGYKVVKIGNASTSYQSSTIIDYTSGKKPITLSFLKKRLNIQNVKTAKNGGSIDLLVILGKDFKLN